MTNSATYAYLTNSALVDNVVFKNGATTRMTTSNRYDNLNRLTLKESRTGVSPVSSFAYAYNPANQRTAITNVDSSRWAYAYDTLGQVTSGNELHAPTKAPEVPTKMMWRWDSFSATNASRHEAKLAYSTKHPNTMPASECCPGSPGAWFREFVPSQHARFAFSQGCDRPSYVAPVYFMSRPCAAT